MKNISIEQLNKIVDNINLIDIRDNYLYNIDHIPNAINIPMNLLLMNPNNYLEKDKVYYIYCSYGISSKKACKELLLKGFNVVNIDGGFNCYNLCKHIYK